jgi:hypothetical protein
MDSIDGALVSLGGGDGIKWDRISPMAQGPALLILFVGMF